METETGTGRIDFGWGGRQKHQLNGACRYATNFQARSSDKARSRRRAGRQQQQQHKAKQLGHIWPFLHRPVVYGCVRVCVSVCVRLLSNQALKDNKSQQHTSPRQTATTKSAHV